VDALTKKIVSALQGDIPLVREPYRQLARELGISEGELLERLSRMKSDGLLRRVAAVLRHRRVGFVANAMVAWRVPEEEVEDAGQAMASFPEASHVYRRPAFPDWPYNIYTMIHGTSREECEEVVEKMSSVTGIGDCVVLYSTREFKKTSMDYFEGGEGER